MGTFRTILLISVLLSFTAEAGLKAKDAFPALKLPVMAGRTPSSGSGDISIRNFKGQVVLVDFWASWCEPCKVALPQYNRLYQKYAKKGLVVWGINEDDEKADGKSFIKDHPVKFPTSYDVGKKLATKVGLKTMPTSFIIGKDGKVKHIHEGFREGDEADVEALIKKLL